MAARKATPKKSKAQEEIEVDVAEILDYMKVTGLFASVLRDVVERKVAVNAAKQAGSRVTTRQLQKAADTFRMANGLAKASDTHAWLESRGLSVETLEEYLKTNLLISSLKAKLDRNASKTKYYRSEEVEDLIREMVYRDWLSKALE